MTGVEDGQQNESERTTLIEHAVSTADVHYSSAEAAGVVTTVKDTELVTDNPLRDNPLLSIGHAETKEGNNGTVDLIFEVTLSELSSVPVIADWETSDGTATAGEDYESAKGTVNVVAGATKAEIRVKVLGDEVQEPNETLVVTLSNVRGATLDAVAGTGTILDDDILELSIAQAEVVEGDTGSVELVYEVSLSAPSTMTVSADWETSDGTATEGEDYVATSGTLVLLPGTLAAQIRVVVLGDVVDEPDETLVITFSNVQQAVLHDAMVVGTVLDDDHAMLSIASAQVVEGDASTAVLVFEVSLTTPATAAVSVDWVTSNGTATAGEDYQAGSGTLTIAPGQRFVTIAVVVLGDVIDEPDETLVITLSNVKGALLGGATAVGTLLDDDRALLSIESAAVSEGDTGSAELVFGVSLSVPSAVSISVEWTTADVTATAGEDYEAVTGTLSLPPGETSGEIRVQVLGDEVDEAHETLTVTLVNVNGAELVNEVAVGTVVDDDQAMLSIASAQTMEGDTGMTELPFEVLLSTPSAAIVSADWATSDGTATAGEDYQSASGTLTFLPKETTGTIRIQVHGDVVDEPNETVMVTLSNVSQAGLVDAVATGTVVDDDEVQVSISSVHVAEGDSGMTDANFEISLSSPSWETLRLWFGTADGDALAGQDYEPQEGSLLFNPGDTVRTLTIGVFGDDEPEHDETFLVWLSESEHGLETMSARGVIVDDDSMDARSDVAKTTLAGLGRTFAADAVDAIRGREGCSRDRTHRMSADVTGSATAIAAGDQMSGDPLLKSTLGTQLGGISSSGSIPRARVSQIGTRSSKDSLHTRWTSLNGTDVTEFDSSKRLRSREHSYTSDFQSVVSLLPRSFQVGAGAGMGTDEDCHQGFGAWGRVTASRFHNHLGSYASNGDLTTGYLGVDRRHGEWLYGVALSHMDSEADISALTDNSLSSEAGVSMTSVMPYGHRSFDSGSAWGLLSAGSGGAVFADQLGDIETDLFIRLAAMGVRRELTADDDGRWRLAATGDAFSTQLAAEGVDSVLPKTVAEAKRVRLLFEGNLALATSEISSTEILVEAGGRWDGGDAAGGSGLDIGLSMRYQHAEVGLEVQADARYTLIHESDLFEDQSLSLAVALDPGTSGQGWHLNLAPSWRNGADGVSGAALSRRWMTDVETTGLSKRFNGTHTPDLMQYRFLSETESNAIGYEATLGHAWSIDSRRLRYVYATTRNGGLIGSKWHFGGNLLISKRFSLIARFELVRRVQVEGNPDHGFRLTIGRDFGKN